MSDAPFRPFDTHLDRQAAVASLRDTLSGAEDGELFLERRPVGGAALRRRPRQAGELRRPRGIRPARRARRDRGICPFDRDQRKRAEACGRDRTARHRRRRRHLGDGAGEDQPHALHRCRSHRRTALRRQGRDPGRDRRLSAGPRSARRAGDGFDRCVPAGGRDPSRRRFACHGRSAHDAGERQCHRRGERPPRKRERRRRRARGPRRPARAGRTGRKRPARRCASPLVNLRAEPAPAGTFDIVLGPGWPGILLHEAVGHGLEGDFNRKGSSAFAGPHGAEGGCARRHGARRRYDPGSSRLDHGGRRGHAERKERADRGRHPRRLHAGPPERPAHGRRRNGQRTAGELCPCADAADDQHLHAGRRGDAPRIWWPISRTGSMPSASAAGRWTSPTASSCSPAPRPTACRTARSARRSRARR